MRRGGGRSGHGRFQDFPPAHEKLQTAPLRHPCPPWPHTCVDLIHTPATLPFRVAAGCAAGTALAAYIFSAAGSSITEVSAVGEHCEITLPRAAVCLTTCSIVH